MKSVGASGTAIGCQRIGSGGAASPSFAPVFRYACASGAQLPVTTEGWRRYSQLRRLSARGAVKALPETSSA